MKTTNPPRPYAVGAVLGAAIGDAMGHPTEFERDPIAKWPPRGVEGFALWWHDSDGRRFAPYTDDTQLAELVLRALLWARDEGGGDLDAAMRRLAGDFVRWANEPQGGHRAPGGGCLAGCRALEAGYPWHEAGSPGAGGCGSVMRAYPAGLVLPTLELAEAWAVAQSRLTHAAPIALAACAAMAVGTARARGRVGETLRVMVRAAGRHDSQTAGMMQAAIDAAAQGVPPEVKLAELEGWAAHEAIAAACYLFARHADDFAAGVLEAANTPGDSDSLATLFGALAGARRGIGMIPSAWVRDVERGAELRALALRV